MFRKRIYSRCCAFDNLNWFTTSLLCIGIWIPKQLFVIHHANNIPHQLKRRQQTFLDRTRGGVHCFVYFSNPDLSYSIYFIHFSFSQAYFMDLNHFVVGFGCLRFLFASKNVKFIFDVSLTQLQFLNIILN